jgi:L-ascorbate metabolism protein UlaG (beta-lactamase superfamily)
VRLQKFGHCCLLVSQAGSRLLIDPGCFSHGIDQLTDLTAILITHVHEDHLDPARLAAILHGNPAARVISDPASAAALAECAITAEVVQAGHELDLGLQVRVYGHEHSVIHPDLPNVPNVGYLIGGRFFYAGDALTVPDRNVEILAVPVAAPWISMTEIINWLRAIRPRVAIPIYDDGHVLAELTYHLVDRLTPPGTTLMALTAGFPFEFTTR